MMDSCRTTLFGFLSGVPQRSGCRKTRNLGGRNLDLLAGLGVDSHSGFLFYDPEGAEIRNPNLSLLFFQRLVDSRYNGIQGQSGSLLRYSCFFRHMGYKFGFRHDNYLLTENKKGL